MGSLWKTVTKAAVIKITPQVLVHGSVYGDERTRNTRSFCRYLSRKGTEISSRKVLHCEGYWNAEAPLWKS